MWTSLTLHFMGSNFPYLQHNKHTKYWNIHCFWEKWSLCVSKVLTYLGCLDDKSSQAEVEAGSQRLGNIWTQAKTISFQAKYSKKFISQTCWHSCCCCLLLSQDRLDFAWRLTVDMHEHDNLPDSQLQKNKYKLGLMATT